MSDSNIEHEAEVITPGREVMLPALCERSPPPSAVGRDGNACQRSAAFGRQTSEHHGGAPRRCFPRLPLPPPRAEATCLCQANIGMPDDIKKQEVEVVASRRGLSR